jgi:hypothetical protein
MPTFQVMVNPSALKGERGSEQAIVVTATNTIERPATARVNLRTGSASGWVTPPRDNLGRFPAKNATREFTFTLRIPKDAPAGSYLLLFDVVDIDLGDDHFGTSPALALVLAAEPVVLVNGKPKRWWILAVAAVVVLGVGFLLWKVFFDSMGTECPTSRNDPTLRRLRHLRQAGSW